MIYRVQHNKDNPYFMLNRTAVEDDRLSFKAVGILTYLLSKPDNWTVQEVDLANRHTDGTSAVRTGLGELKEHGYLRKAPLRDPATGRITGWETHVYEIPIDAETHNVENPHSGESTNREINPIVNNDSSLVSIEGSDQPPASSQPKTVVAPYPAFGEMGNLSTAGQWANARGQGVAACPGWKKEMRPLMLALLAAHHIQEAALEDSTLRTKWMRQTLRFHEAGLTSTAAVQALARRWSAENPFGQKGQAPAGDQLLTFHFSATASGSTAQPATDPSGAPLPAYQPVLTDDWSA